MIRRVLFTGGARSGKSTAAERLAGRVGTVTYVATAPDIPDDPEWRSRIDEHRARRPSHWTTVDTTDVAATIRAMDARQLVLIDCLTLWLTARMDARDAWADPASALPAVLADIDDLTDSVRTSVGSVVLVTNEVGSGIVPDNGPARMFRDVLGRCNSSVAGVCDDVYLVVAGRLLPLTRDVP